MRWRTGRRSQNIEDRRGTRLRSRPVLGGGIGTIVLVVAALYFGIDPSIFLTGMTDPAPQSYDQDYQPSPQEQELADFVSVVLADTEDVWTSIFQQLGRRYDRPVLVLFSGAVNSACGLAQAATGPFYCPRDQQVYIDLGFYQELRERFSAPGDFAQAYVIAHEIGHHVQTLLGISEQVHAARIQLPETEANQLSVRQELQADCFAGLWASHAQDARQILEEGDIDEALNAASAIGDDRLQKQSSGYVTPESFTHGTSEQRARWFRRGFKGGSLEDCDTFSASL